MPRRTRLTLVLVTGFALSLVPLVASAASFASGTTSASWDRPTPDPRGMLRSALATSMPPTLTEQTAGPPLLELFYERSWVYIRSGLAGAPGSNLRYALSFGEAGEISIDFDLASYIDWARQSGRVRVNGIDPSGTNPIPEPTAALLFATGLGAFAVRRRTRRS